MGSNCYNLPIESDRFNCITTHVKNSDFLLIENGHPTTTQSHTFNSIPSGLPHLPFNSWCQFQPHFLLTCIYQTKRVDVKVLKWSVVGKYVFSGPFNSELNLDWDLIICLHFLDDSSVLIDKEESLVLEHRSGWGEGALRKAGYQLISFWFFVSLEFYNTAFLLKIILLLFRLLFLKLQPWLIVLLLNVHRFFIFDVPDVLVEVSVVAHAEEGVVEGEGCGEVEVRYLE